MPTHAKFRLAAAIATATLIGTLFAVELPPFREFPGVEYSLGTIKFLPITVRKRNGPLHA